MKKEPADNNSNIRNLAEKKLRSRKAKADKNNLPELKKVLHELEVHQIELEMQIGELRTIQIALAEARQKYFDLYNLAPVSYLTISEKKVITEANLAAGKLLGGGKNQLKNKLITDFIVKEDQNIFLLQMKYLLETHKKQQFDLRMKKNKEIFWANMKCDIMRGQGDLVINVTINDISGRKKAEAALKESNNRFNSLIKELNDVVWTATLDGSHILDVSNAFEKFCGISAEKFKANPKLWIEMVHPDDRQIAEESDRELFENGRATAEYRIVRPDGSIVWILDRKSLIYDENGKAVQMGGVAKDITERKLAEEELHRKEEHHKDVIENIFKFIPEGVLVFTESLNLLKQNKAFDDIVHKYAPLLGYTEEELAEQITEQLRSKIVSGDAAEIRIMGKKPIQGMR